MDTKKFYESKTFWVNIIAIFYIIFGNSLGIGTLDPTTEATILGIINLLLRIITKLPITFF
jgi:hypothetical protein